MNTKKHFIQFIAAIQVISLFAMPISAFGADYTTPISVGSGSTLEIKSTDYDNVDIQVSGVAVNAENSATIKVFNDSSSVSNNVTIKNINTNNSNSINVSTGGNVVVNGKTITVEKAERDGCAIKYSGIINIGTDATENITISGCNAISGSIGTLATGTLCSVLAKNINIDGGVSGNYIIGSVDTDVVDIDMVKSFSSTNSVGASIGTSSEIHGKNINICGSSHGISTCGGSLLIGDANSIVNIATHSTSSGHSGIYVRGQNNDLVVNGKEITIDTLSAYDYYGGYSSGTVTIGTEDTDKVKIKRDAPNYQTINIAGGNSVTIEGKEIEIVGNTQFQNDYSGTNKLEINKSGNGTVKIDGYINSYNSTKSDLVNILDLTLNGADSYVNGFIAARDKANFAVTMKNGAQWNIPAGEDNKVNNLTVDNATINIATMPTAKTLYVDTLTANDLTIAGTDATKNKVQFTDATVTGNLNLSNATTQATGAFVADSANINGAIALNGTTDFKGTNTIAGAVTGTATVNINSGVTAIDDTNGSVANNIVTASGATLKANASKVTAANFTNNGTYDVTGGNLTQTITGSGNISISGDVVNDAGVTQNQNITVNATHSLTNNGTLAGAVTNKGSLTNGATGNIIGDLVNEVNAVLTNNGTMANITNKGTATNNKTIKGDLTNKGGAKFTNETTGLIEGNATNERDGILINKGTINGWLKNDGDYTSEGGKITGDIINSGEFTANADDITSTITNSGDLVITGGTISYPIISTGELGFSGKTTVNAQTTISGSLAFYLDKFKANDTIVTATVPMDISKTNIVLYHDSEKELFNADDTVTLIKGQKGYTATETAPNKITAKKSTTGLPTDYIYDVYGASDSLIAKYTGEAKPSEETKSLSEGRMGAAIALTQANDTMAGDGIESAVSAANSDQGTSAAFASIQGNTGRYTTGSHIDLNSVNIAAGLAKTLKNGNTTVGAYIEGGNGRYTSYNEFENTPEVRADGDINYFGAGIFARHNFNKTDKGNMYADASFGAGHTNQDYASDKVGTATNVRYDTSQAYLKAHATLGYILNLKDNSTLNAYAKYLWTRQNGDSAQISQDEINFDAINSHRLRLGARYTQNITKNLSWYGGLAYEYEFDMAAGANSKGYAIAEPDLKGGSGMAELGLKYTPKKASDWMFNLGVQGFTGKRDALGVKLGAEKKF